MRSAFELLHVEQSGFRLSHSCQTALTKLVDTWLEGMDNGNITGVSLLDFRKAFDLVNLSFFADGATLRKSAPSVDLVKVQLSSDVDNVNNLCRENGMIINENKSRCIAIGTSQNMSKLQPNALAIDVNGNTLEHIDFEKLLGVHIDTSLQFNKYVDHVCRSITLKIALLRRIKRYLPLSYRKLKI